MVNVVIRKWERQLLEKGTPLGEIRILVAIFYADDGLIAAHIAPNLQTTINLLTKLFNRVGLKTNTTKTKVMTFLSGKIRTALSKDAYRARMVNILCQERKGRKVECQVCGKSMAVGLLAKHLSFQHDVCPNLCLVDREGAVQEDPRRWDVAFVPNKGCYRCPVPDCPKGRESHGARDSWNLRFHFVFHHQPYRVVVGGIYLPKCNLCRINGRDAHPPGLKPCVTLVAARRQHAIAKEGLVALQEGFAVYKEPLIRVE